MIWSIDLILVMDVTMSVGMLKVNEIEINKTSLVEHAWRQGKGGWQVLCVVECLVRNPDLGIMGLEQIQQERFCSLVKMERTATNISTCLKRGRVLLL